ncbi:MAG: SPFH domain-containing protein [Phycisphaerae bacterium]
MHQHHHHHHHHSDVPEEPLDAASQSLSDAMRASFGILKVIMGILVVLYFFSNVGGIQAHEEVLVLRLGKLQPTVRDAGLSWAFPYPIDEVVRLPTKGSNDLKVTSHTFYRTEREVGKQLSFLSPRSSGLNPVQDGALLTSDAGLVHVEWELTYKIDDVIRYVSNLEGRNLEAAEELITLLVETSGIEVAGEMTAAEFTRTKIEQTQSELMRRVNLRLGELDSGIRLTRVNVKDATVPLAVRNSFVRTQQVENQKEEVIRNAKRDQTKRLNEAVGAIYPQMVAAIDMYERDATPENRKKVEDLLDLAEGEVGEMIKEADSYFSVVVGRMRSDVETYRTLVREYETNPAMLIERLWESTRTQIFNNPDVKKIYKPLNLAQMRLEIGLDPEDVRADEERAVTEKEFNMEDLRPKTWKILGPEYN